MKNKSKIITALSLSSLAAIALVSCGANGGGVDKAGFHVYAVSNDDELYDEACISYEAVGDVAYNKDLVIKIKPNQYFSLKDESGKMILPYVGLGSPVNKFEHDLPKDMAWTYEDKTIGKAESYELKVRGEYFKKNVIVSYGDGPTMSTYHYEPVRCMESDLYFTKPDIDPKKPPVPITPENLGTFDRSNSHATHPLTSDVFAFNKNKSKANYANEHLTFAFNAINNKENMIVNDLLDLKAYEVTQAYTPVGYNAEEVPASEFKYIKVVGVAKEAGDSDVILSQRTVSGPNITVNADEENGYIYVNIPWSMVIKEGSGEGSEYGFTNKFKQIDFKFDPVYLNHVTDNSGEFDIIPNFGNSIKDYRAGYLTEDIVKAKQPQIEYEANVWDRSIFRQNGGIRFGYTQDGTSTSTSVHSEEVFDSICSYSFPNNHRYQLARKYSKDQPHFDIMRPGFNDSAVDQEALSDKSPKSVSLYSANFICDSFKPEQIKITTKTVEGATTPLEWSEKKTTNWRQKYYEQELRQPLTDAEELDYWETTDGNWRLVFLNNKPREVGVDAFTELYSDGTGNFDLRNKENAYVLYSLNGTKPFVGYKTINIDVA